MHYNALNIETAAQQVWLYFICRTTRPWHYLWINASLTRYIVLSSNLIKGKECKSDFTKLYQTWAMRSMRCLSEKQILEFHSKILHKISSHNKEEKPPKIYLFAEQEFMYPTFSMLMVYETSFRYLFNVLRVSFKSV